MIWFTYSKMKYEQNDKIEIFLFYLKFTFHKQIMFLQDLYVPKKKKKEEEEEKMTTTNDYQ